MEPDPFEPFAPQVRARLIAEDWRAAERTRWPRRKVAILTCMDSRIDVFDRLGLDSGDAHVIRNAGALVTDDMLRSLVISQRKLGTREVVLIGHTDCGLQGLDDEAFDADLVAEAGVHPSWRAGGFGEVADSVRRGFERLATCAFLPHREHLSAYVLDVSSGSLREVGHDHAPSGQVPVDPTRAS
jgi:carbonic anhydrase